MSHSKQQRRLVAPPGMEVQVGVGRGKHASVRCQAKHDVPWSERCVLDETHVLLKTEHKDKKGRTW